MGWFKKLIPGSKDKETKGIGALLPMPAYGRVNPELLFNPNGNHYGVDWTGTLPQNVMQMIFEYVCPHTMDESYECNEDSAEEMGCMLCNMRDLSYCVLVCKRWRKFAVPVLYRSIRIDSVHYCSLEDELDERRIRKASKWDRNADPENTGLARMKLLCRTLRDDTLGLGNCILILKTPYMIRESCKADLARIAAVAPNLRYADLPQGFYSSEQSCGTLRQEVENRCPDIRKMAYNHGSEEAIKNLATGRLWINLEVLELNNLTTGAAKLSEIFSVLENLQVLKVTGLVQFTDDLFKSSPTYMDFPPLSSLIIKDCPKLTVNGLQMFLSNPINAQTLRHLEIEGTNIKAYDVHHIISAGTALQHFSLVDTVTDVWPTDYVVPPLQSRSLLKLHFEITVKASESHVVDAEKYHAYLATSLLSNGLPSLQQLFVRDPTFPDLLIKDELAPPMPSFMGDTPRLPFAGRGTGGGGANRQSTASNSTAFGSPPTRSGGFTGSNLPSSPERASGFAPSSLSPPRAPGLKQEKSHARRESQHFRQQQIQQLPQTNVSLASLAPPAPQGLRYPLEVFTKGLDEMEWNFSSIQPAAAQGRKASSSGARPISMVGMNANGSRMSGVFGSVGAPGNAAGYRGSIMVPNGLGGYALRAEPEKAFDKAGKGEPEDEDAAFFRQMATLGIQAPPKVSRGNVKEKKLGLF